jgi:hypothetical protein
MPRNPISPSQCILMGMDDQERTAPNLDKTSPDHGERQTAERGAAAGEQELRQGGAADTAVTRIGRWLFPILWFVLGLVVLSLFALAAVLLLRSHVLSSKSLTDEQTKSLWTFLGVAFAAVATLIGALLTEQHNRRTDALTQQAVDREQIARQQQQMLARDTENRLKIDTVTKVLELVTIDGGGYAPRACVAGAIATLMQLGGGEVGIRILGELWAAEAVDSDTAVWLIGRVLQDSGARSDEIVEAAALLGRQARRLVPTADDPEQGWYSWPMAFTDSWPATLPYEARTGLFTAAVEMLLAREFTWWQSTTQPVPIKLFVNALDDDKFGVSAARALKALLDAGAFRTLDFPIDAELVRRIRELSASAEISPGFNLYIAELSPWAKGRGRPRICSAVRNWRHGPRVSPEVRTTMLWAQSEVDTQGPMPPMRSTE